MGIEQSSKHCSNSTPHGYHQCPEGNSSWCRIQPPQFSPPGFRSSRNWRVPATVRSCRREGNHRRREWTPNPRRRPASRGRCWARMRCWTSRFGRRFSGEMGFCKRPCRIRLWSKLLWRPAWLGWRLSRFEPCCEEWAPIGIRRWRVGTWNRGTVQGQRRSRIRRWRPAGGFWSSLEKKSSLCGKCRGKRTMGGFTENPLNSIELFHVLWFVKVKSKRRIEN